MAQTTTTDRGAGGQDLAPQGLPKQYLDPAPVSDVGCGNPVLDARCGE